MQAAASNLQHVSTCLHDHETTTNSSEKKQTKLHSEKERENDEKIGQQTTDKRKEKTRTQPTKSRTSFENKLTI